MDLRQYYTLGLSMLQLMLLLGTLGLVAAGIYEYLI